jgi:O-antigen/teichoic acid export membrane protein
LQKKIGVLIGYLNLFIQNTTTFILTPVMLSVWSTSEFGVYKLVISITGFFMLLDFGMGNSIIKFISEYKSKKETLNERKLFFLMLLFNITITIVLLALSLTLVNFFPDIFKTFSSEELTLASALFSLLIINSAFNLIINTFNSIIRAYEKFVFWNSINLIKNICRFIFFLTFLYMGFTPTTIVIIDIIITLIIGLITIFYVVYKIKLIPYMKGINLIFIKRIYFYSFFVFIEMVAYQLFWSIDVIFLGIFTSTIVIAIYSISTIFTAFFESLSSVISSVTMPKIINLVSISQSKTLILEELIKIARIKMFVLILPFIGFLFLGADIVDLWVGEKFKNVYFVVLIIIIPQIFARVQDIFSQVLWAENKQKPKALISIVASILNVIVTISLIPIYGMYGAAIGTAVAFTIGYIFGEGYIVYKVLGYDLIKFYKEVYANSLILYFGIALAAFFITIILGNSWILFGVKTMMICVIYIICVYMFGLRENEKAMLKSLYSK